MPIAEDGGDDMANGDCDVHIDDVSAVRPLGGGNESHFSVAGDFSMIYQDKFKSSGLNFAGPSQFRLKRFNIREYRPSGSSRKKVVLCLDASLDQSTIQSLSFQWALRRDSLDKVGTLPGRKMRNTFRSKTKIYSNSQKTSRSPRLKANVSSREYCGMLFLFESLACSNRNFPVEEK